MNISTIIKTQRRLLLLLSSVLICCTIMLLLLDKFIVSELFNTALAQISKTSIPTYMISTKGNASYPQEINGSGYGNNYLFSNLTKLFEPCSNETTIFVHGWGNTETEGKERLDRVKLSLEKNNYAYPLVGLSWNSDKLWEPSKWIAKESGLKLAHFILNLKEKCQDTKVRLIAHSLGARVVLSSLDSLHKNPTWNKSNFTLASVHLMAGAVDDEEVSKDPSDISADSNNAYSVKSAYGEAIEKEVERFYNLRNSEDNVLEMYPFRPFDLAYRIYPFFEGDLALGLDGYQKLPKNITLPTNYNEVDVGNNIIDNHDADGIEGEDFGLCNKLHNVYTFCQIKKQGWDFGLCNAIGFCRVDIGDNHAGYIGFRNLNNKSLIVDDGAIDVIVGHWNSE